MTKTKTQVKDKRKVTKSGNKWTKIVCPLCHKFNCQLNFSKIQISNVTINCDCGNFWRGGIWANTLKAGEPMTKTNWEKEFIKNFTKKRPHGLLWKDLGDSPELVMIFIRQTLEAQAKDILTELDKYKCGKHMRLRKLLIDIIN